MQFLIKITPFPDRDLNLVLKFFEHKLVTETVERLRKEDSILGELLYNTIVNILKV